MTTMMTKQTHYILSDEDLEAVIAYSTAIFSTYSSKQLADIFQVDPRQLGNSPSQQTLNELCYSLYKNGHLKRIAVAAAKARQPTEEIIDLLCQLAGVFYHAHYHEWAYHLYRRAVHVGQKIWGQEHIEVARLINNSAAMLLGMGKIEEAIQTSMDALAMADKTTQGANKFKAMIQHNLGSMLSKAEQLQEAYDNYYAGYVARSELFGQAHPDTISSMKSMGVLLYKVRKFEESLMYLEQAFLAQYYLASQDVNQILSSLIDLIAVFDEAAANSNDPIFEERAQPYKRLIGELQSG